MNQLKVILLSIFLFVACAAPGITVSKRYIEKEKFYDAKDMLLKNLNYLNSFESIPKDDLAENYFFIGNC